MKIAWFTPFTKTSAIGKVSAQVCEKMICQHDVEIWTQHSSDLISTTVPVVHFDANIHADALKDYDAIVYNLGNFAGFHREIMDVALKVPGIVLLHDRTMHGFWGQYYCMPEYGGAPDKFELYQEMIREYYGDNAAEALNRVDKSSPYPIFEQEPIKSFAMLEPCLRGARGVFTHSKQFADELTAYTNLPIEYSYLPCAIPESLPKMPVNLAPIINKARKEKRKILISTGIVHPVKRIDKVVSVLCNRPDLAAKICYIVIGDYSGPYGADLKKIADTKLQGCLHMLGYQSLDTMFAALAEADVAINLRYPNSEVCSLSLLEQMAFGKPVLVLNRGIYDEMPENAVLRIPLEKESEGIVKVLSQLVANTLDSQVGDNAKHFIQQQCSTETYCEKVCRLIDQVTSKVHVANLQNRFLWKIGETMGQLGLTESTVPASVAVITDRLMRITDGVEIPAIKKHVMGVWMGFPYHVPGLHREGISRLMSYLISNMLLYHEDVEIEVWCYDFNREEAEIICGSVRQLDRSRLKIITEENWVQQLDATPMQQIQLGEIKVQYDNLVDAARLASRASVFIPLIFYLDRVSETDRRLVVPGYDMAVAGHYKEFLEKDPLYAARNSEYIWRAENLAARGALFFCNSDTVRETEILRFIRNLHSDNAYTVYLPANVPSKITEQLIDEDILRKKFSLQGPYLFYPTQIRPYKNVSTLIKALHLLRKRRADVTLVLTGSPSDVPEVERLIGEYSLSNNILVAKDVTETELFSMYRYAAAAPVPSVFEGGFHYQAMEALSVGTPIVLADIPIVRERILSLGFSIDNCGVTLFSPLDAEELANKLDDIMENREKFSLSQQSFADALLGYTWRDACEQYHELFFEGTIRTANRNNIK